MSKKQIPEHWATNSWEEKARENPLYAVMTMSEMEAAGADDFSEEHLGLFFEKGRRLAERLVYPSLEKAPLDGIVVEYGCGAGRILNALVERGIACTGVDISSTMLKHCRRLVPGVQDYVCLDDGGHVGLPDECARLVYSYAVVQHIDSLAAYERATSEMCRLLVPGGRLILQVNCEDFSLAVDGELGRTENYEDHSIHFAPSSSKGIVHKNSTWSGVYIGLDRLKALLLDNGVQLTDVEPFNQKKLRAVVCYGIKSERIY